MDAKDFAALLRSTQTLSRAQRHKLMGALEAAASGDEVVALVNSKMDEPGVACPYCFASDPYRWGCKDAVQRYRCRACSKTFMPLTGTPLARLRHREAWLRFAQAMVDGLSVRKAAAAANIHRTTSFRWRHRMLADAAHLKDTEMSGIVEADETFFLESFKGSKAWAKAARGLAVVPPRAAPRKRGGVASKRGISYEQVPVLVVRDRTGKHFDAVLRVVDKHTMGVLLPQLLAPDVVLCTDGAGVYKSVAKDHALAHEPLNHKGGTRVKQRVFHIQNVNAYDSRLKAWMARFRGVATKNLFSYLGWRRLLDRHGDSLTAVRFLRIAME